MRLRVSRLGGGLCRLVVSLGGEGGRGGGPHLGALGEGRYVLGGRHQEGPCVFVSSRAFGKMGTLISWVGGAGRTEHGLWFLMRREGSASQAHVAAAGRSAVSLRAGRRT